MKWRSAALVLLVLGACAPHTSDIQDARARCRQSRGHFEVNAKGRVSSVLGIHGSRTGAQHEGFLFSPAGTASAPVRVEDNIAITGYIPLHAGDEIELKGQYECNDGVIHWTHRDPAGRHSAGYIKLKGATYQ